MDTFITEVVSHTKEKDKQISINAE
jgi:hypothetical protein